MFFYFLYIFFGSCFMDCVKLCYVEILFLWIGNEVGFVWIYVVGFIMFYIFFCDIYKLSLILNFNLMFIFDNGVIWFVKIEDVMEFYS